MFYLTSVLAFLVSVGLGLFCVAGGAVGFVFSFMCSAVLVMCGGALALSGNSSYVKRGCSISLWGAGLGALTLLIGSIEARNWLLVPVVLLSLYGVHMFSARGKFLDSESEELAQELKDNQPFG